MNHVNEMEVHQMNSVMSGEYEIVSESCFLLHICTNPSDFRVLVLYICEFVKSGISDLCIAWLGGISQWRCQLWA